MDPRRDRSASTPTSRKRKHKEIDEIEASDEEVEKKSARKKSRKEGDSDVKGKTTQELLATLDPPPPIVAREFSSHDTDFLSRNENFRYLGSSKKVGHIVVVKNAEGEEVALQFHIPPGEEQDTPDIRLLEDIEEIERYGLKRYRAHTPDGTRMFTTRYEDGEFNGEAFRVFNFSPTPKTGKEPFWGSEKDLTMFDPKALEDPDVKAELEELIKKGTVFKGGRDFPVEPSSVQRRDQVKTRKPDQNTVMGESARDAYEAFFDTWTDELTPEIKKIFKRAFEAPLKGAFYSQYRPEWLHAEGHSLTPVKIDPQRKDNLGAAGKWVNTEMMVLERIVKWFALNRPAAMESIKPHFEMLLDSELIKRVKFEVSVEEQGNIVKLLQDINPLKEWPIFRKPSDLMQATAITYSMLNGIDPVKRQTIKKGGETLRARPGNPGRLKTILEPVRPRLADWEAQARPTVPLVPPAAPPAAVPQIAAPALAAVEGVSAFPTHASWQNSVVRINTTAKEYDFSEPWVGSKQISWRGSGFVIEREGKKYIVTNAHVAGGAVNMTVRFANGKTRYQAKLKQIARHCDLAMLVVEEKEFQEKAVAVEVGEMLALTQKVQVVGFPRGGDEVYTSIGVVSRIEVGDYCESEMPMLYIGVDAAINGGNSGGPVFANGKVVGVAFQGWPLQGLGYMIPPPIISHFITEVFSGKPYRGFPILPIKCEQIGNKLLRKYYGMQPEQTGVRIHKIDPCCDAFQKLKKDDILLSIDGMVVSNDGQVDVPGVGENIDLIHVTHSKFIGDSVKLKVLRKNETTKQAETLEISVLLDRVPGETTKVAKLENHLPPSYFVCSGFSFEPVTENYLNQRGSDLTEHVDLLTHEGIEDIAKKTPDEQIVVVNDVLACEATEEYEDLINAVVKKINGKEIKNIRDVVVAMERHTLEGHENEHVLEFGGGEIAVVPRMSKDENDRLLAEYDIKADRSKDLHGIVPVDAMDLDEPVATSRLQVVLPAPALAIVRPTPQRATTARVKKLMASAPKPSAPSEEELMPGWDGSEEFVSKPKKRELTLDDFSGVKHYRSAIDRIEAEAKLRQQLGIDEEEIALEDLGEGEEEDFEKRASSESSSMEEEESSEKEVKAHNRRDVQPRQSRSAARHPMFAPTKRKHDHEEDEEERNRHKKRKR